MFLLNKKLKQPITLLQLAVLIDKYKDLIIPNFVVIIYTI